MNCIGYCYVNEKEVFEEVAKKFVYGNSIVKIEGLHIWIEN